MTEQARIVELAVQAAGVADDKWADRVVTLVPRVAALFREPHDESDPNSLLNTARKVAEANVFTAEYRGHEFDDNTKRVFVKLFDEKNQDGDYLDDDGNQTVRTEPMWSATGRATRRILERMAPGQRGVFYRYTEQIDKKRKMGLLVHVEPLGRPPQEGQREAPTARSAPVEETRTDPHPSPSGSHSPESAITGRINALTNKQKVALARAAREAGISNVMSPEEDQSDKVLVLIGEVERQ